MKGYVFGWLSKINHMKIFSSQKRYCQEVILFDNNQHTDLSALRCVCLYFFVLWVFPYRLLFLPSMLFVCCTPLMCCCAFYMWFHIAHALSDTNHSISSSIWPSVCDILFVGVSFIVRSIFQLHIHSMLVVIKCLLSNPMQSSCTPSTYVTPTHRALTQQMLYFCVFLLCLHIICGFYW